MNYVITYSQNECSRGCLPQSQNLKRALNIPKKEIFPVGGNN